MKRGHMDSYALHYTKGNQKCVAELTHIVEKEFAPDFETSVCIVEYIQRRLMLYKSLNPVGSRPVKVIDSSNDEHGLLVVRNWLHELDEDWITIYQEGEWVYWVRKSEYDKFPEKIKRGLKEAWQLLNAIKSST